MDKNLQEQIEIYLSRLRDLLRRGRQLREALAGAGSQAAAVAATRAWQEDCGVTMNQLSGGSKAHWLARSFSEAFLKRSARGNAVEGATPEEIVERLMGVLEQAVSSLAQVEERPMPSASSEPAPRRFDFVHNPELRPVVEGAYADSKRSLEQKDFDTALRTSCGILEAIVTDALEHRGLAALAAAGAPPGNISEWPFETRLSVAEKAGLIRGGCARLPAAARTYRDQDRDQHKGGFHMQVSERDARLAGQVLHVVMRDLNPGR